MAADERHVTVEVAWHCAQQLRACYHQASHREGRALAERVLASFSSCPIPEVARLGRTLRTWRREFVGYFDTESRHRRHRRPRTQLDLDAAQRTDRPRPHECSDAEAASESAGAVHDPADALQPVLQG
ncbi:transposase [Microbacterium sp. NPDC078428]|uniref:transposase n=1 Tax=Microbacterium sp. NPDC078428 TaxID=3364190 RepID=UPI0037C548C3